MSEKSNQTFVYENFNVFLRFQPLTESQKRESTRNKTKESYWKLTEKEALLEKDDQKKIYRADHIFLPNDTHERVFQVSMQNELERCLNEKNDLCAVCYGERASGKSYTTGLSMFREKVQYEENGEFYMVPVIGLLPQTIIFLLHKKSTEERFKNMKIEASIFRILFESIDCMVTWEKNLPVHGVHLPYIKNLFSQEIDGFDMFDELLQIVQENHQQHCDDYIGRCNVCCILKITNTSEGEDDDCFDIFFVKLRNPGRARYGFDNRSIEEIKRKNEVERLLKVMEALETKKKFIPFRDSKLTRLLGRYLQNEVIVRRSGDGRDKNDLQMRRTRGVFFSTCHIGSMFTKNTIRSIEIAEKMMINREPRTIEMPDWYYQPGQEEVVVQDYWERTHFMLEDGERVSIRMKKENFDGTNFVLFGLKIFFL